MITDDNPAYDIHTVTGIDNIHCNSKLTLIFIMVIITGEHLTTDDDNTYSYVHVLDEPVVEDDYN